MCYAAPSSAPTAFQATSSDATSIVLSWDPPLLEDQNGIIRHYEVTLIALETGEIHIRTSTTLSITVSSLRPYTTYNCTVAAETVATGPSTVGIVIQTLQTGNYHFEQYSCHVRFRTAVTFIHTYSAICTSGGCTGDF